MSIWLTIRLTVSWQTVSWLNLELLNPNLILTQMLTSCQQMIGHGMALSNPTFGGLLIGATSHENIYTFINAFG
jgi:hypothetical protein